MFNKLILYSLKIFHLFIMGLTTFGPLFANYPLLLIIILINIFIVTGWYLYGYCFCTDIENALETVPIEEETNPTDKETNPTDKETSVKKSFVTIMIETNLPFIDKKFVHNLISSIPFFSTCVCIGRLYTMM